MKLHDGRYIIISDLQVPYHDQRAVDAVCDYISRENFDGMLNVGDEADSPEPSRWNKASAMEYGDTLTAGLLRTQQVLMQLTHAVGYDRPHHIMRSNHADRVETYLKRYAPAVAGLAPLKWEALLGYSEPSSLSGIDIPVTYHRELWEFAPGWVLAHGDEAGLNQTAGSTAMGLARKLGKSVVCGHTHRAGYQHWSMGFNGRQTTVLHGVEVGHLMDLKQASYLKTGSANWRQAVAVATVDGRTVDVTLKLLHNGRVVG